MVKQLVTFKSVRIGSTYLDRAGAGAGTQYFFLHSRYVWTPFFNGVTALEVLKRA